MCSLLLEGVYLIVSCTNHSVVVLGEQTNATQVRRIHSFSALFLSIFGFYLIKRFSLLNLCSLRSQEHIHCDMNNAPSLNTHQMASDAQ